MQNTVSKAFWCQEFVDNLMNNILTAAAIADLRKSNEPIVKKFGDNLSEVKRAFLNQKTQVGTLTIM